jgi:hypothetical protein
MEAVDRTRMCSALYPVLLAMTAGGRLSAAQAAAAAAACAPLGRSGAASQQALMLAALDEARPSELFIIDLLAQDKRRRS